MAGVGFKSSDLLADLERIVKLHTRHYQEDFELDKKLLAELCASATPEDHHVIWMSRVNGTHCLREREIFLADSYENHVWHFYHEQLHDSVLAYALTLNGVENGKIKADIFPLDYAFAFENLILAAFGGHRDPLCLLQIPCSRVRGLPQRSVGNRLSDSHRDFFRRWSVGRPGLAADRISDQPIRIAAAGGLCRRIAWRRP